MPEKQVLLDYGSGGKASHRLINDLFRHAFDNPCLSAMDDAAFLDTRGPVVMSTDTFTIDPIFFPGGDIGSLAVHGTVNDVAMLGARPLYLSCAYILEEGFSFLDLEKIVCSMARAAKEAEVFIVTGDTKVVPKGMVDKIFINTTGIGQLLPGVESHNYPSGNRACAGDAVLVSGTMGDHGLAILAGREGLNFETPVKSDAASLNKLTQELLCQVGDVHVLRDPTRGGLVTTLNEIAQQSQVGITIREKAVPIAESVRSGCSFLGLDPLYLANEGKCICILPQEKKEGALRLLRNQEKGKNAACIGYVTEENKGKVTLETPLGGKRLLGMLEGEQLPRIC